MIRFEETRRVCEGAKVKTWPIREFNGGRESGCSGKMHTDKVNLNAELYYDKFINENENDEHENR